MLDCQYFKDHYQIIAVDLSKRKGLDALTIQQIKLYGMLITKSQVYTTLEKAKETVLKFHKETAKGLWIYKWLNTVK